MYEGYYRDYIIGIPEVGTSFAHEMTHLQVRILQVDPTHQPQDVWVKTALVLTHADLRNFLVYPLSSSGLYGLGFEGLTNYQL